jgi:hypothetical protein
MAISLFWLVIWINFISLAPDACLPSVASAEEERLSCPVCPVKFFEKESAANLTGEPIFH